MKRNKKKIGAVILALLAILLILNLVFLFKEKREYNAAVLDVRETYDILYEDLKQLADGKSADFESINHSFIFFTKDFVKWQPLFKECEINRAG